MHLTLQHRSTMLPMEEVTLPDVRSLLATKHYHCFCFYRFKDSACYVVVKRSVDWSKDSLSFFKNPSGNHTSFSQGLSLYVAKNWERSRTAIVGHASRPTTNQQEGETEVATTSVEGRQRNKWNGMSGVLLGRMGFGIIRRLRLSSVMSNFSS